MAREKIEISERTTGWLVDQVADGLAEISAMVVEIAKSPLAKPLADDLAKKAEAIRVQLEAMVALQKERRDILVAIGVPMDDGWQKMGSACQQIVDMAQ